MRAGTAPNGSSRARRRREAWTAPEHEHAPQARNKPRDTCEKGLPGTAARGPAEKETHERRQSQGSTESNAEERQGAEPVHEDEPQAEAKPQDSGLQRLPQTAARGPAEKEMHGRRQHTNMSHRPKSSHGTRAIRDCQTRQLEGPQEKGGVRRRSHAHKRSYPELFLGAALELGKSCRAQRTLNCVSRCNAQVARLKSSRTRPSISTRINIGKSFHGCCCRRGLIVARCVRGTERKLSDPSGHSRPRVEARSRVRVARARVRSVARFATLADLARAGPPETQGA